MKPVRLIIISLLSALVSSCGIANNLTSETYASISTISIGNEVAGGHVTRVYGAGENAAFALGGAIGAMASFDSELTKVQALQKLMEKNNIDVRKKFLRQFTRAISKHELVQGKLVKQGGDAIFKLEIYSLGLYASGPFSSKMEPDVGIRATLFSADGKKIWTNFGYVTALNFKGHEYTLEEYAKDPSKLDRAYDAAIAKAIRSLVGSFKIAMANGEIRLG